MIAEALADRRRRARHDQLRRGPRHRHRAGRPDRGRGADPGLSRRTPTRTGFCAIGSVKTNIGHLDARRRRRRPDQDRAGAEHQADPAEPALRRAQSRDRLRGSPFYVNTAPGRLAARTRAPRRAGRQLLRHRRHQRPRDPRGGAAGCAPPRPAAPAAAAAALGARPAARSRRRAASLAAHLREQPELDLADVAYTFQVGRQAFAHRRDAGLPRPGAAPSRRLAGGRARGGLSALMPRAGEPAGRLHVPRPGRAVRGWPRSSTQTEPTFRASSRPLRASCCSRSSGSTCARFSIRRDAAADAATETPAASADDCASCSTRRRRSPPRPSQLHQTALAQPALFVVEYALAQLWMEWGVRPAALLGHSLGEYVAACLAGVLLARRRAGAGGSARAADRSSCRPARCWRCSLPEAEVPPLLDGDALAGRGQRAARCCRGLGPADAVAALERELLARAAWPAGASRRPHAFHSAMMEPILEPLRALRRRRSACTRPRSPISRT